MAISEEAKKRLLEAKQTVTNPTEQQSGFSASTQERLQAYKEWGAPILQQREDERRAGYEERKALGIDFTAGDSESGKAKYEAAKAGKIATPQSSEQQSTFWDVLDSDTAPNLAPDASFGAKIAKGLWQFGHYSAGGNADTSLPTGLQTDVVQAKQNDPERTLEIGRLSDNDRNEFYRQYDIDPEYAEEWAKRKIAETKANEAESMKAWAEEHPLWGNVASLAPLGATGADIMDVITDVYAGANHYDPFDPLTPTGISQTMREGAKAGSWFGQSGVGQFVDDVLYSSLQSQWSNVVGGGAFEGTGMSSLPLAFYSASAEARSLLQQGYDKREASILATGYGIISFITEAIGSDRIFDKAFKNTAMGEGFKQFGRRLGSVILKSMASEGAEEGAEDIADWVLEGVMSIINGTDHRTFSQYKANRLEEGNSDSKATALAIWDMFLEFNEDVLAGALSGGLMAGTTTTLAQTGELARNTTTAYQHDKKGTKGELVSNIKGIAEASGSNYADNIQATDSKFLKRFAENLKIGEAMSRANRDIYVGAIQDRLEQLGIPLEESRAKAEAIYRNAMGGTLSSKEKTLVNDELSKRVLGEIDDRAGWVYNAYATMSRVSDADTPKLTPEGAVAKMQMEQDKVREAYNSLKPLSEEDYLSLAQKYKDEQAISTNAKPPMQGGTNPMDIRANSSERASQYGAQLLGGVRLANDGDREISEDDMWNSLSPNVGISTESLAAAFAKRKEEVSLNRYANAVDLAYNYGKAGMKLADVVRNIGFSMDSALSEAYKNGQESYVKGLQNNKLRIDRKTANVSYISNEEATKMGVGTVDIASLSDDQNAYIDALDTISKAYGVKMVLFESNGNKNIENGHYDSATNSIYIDVSSMSGLRKYAILSTAAHELVHDFRRIAPEVYDALRQFVIDKYYGGSETAFNNTAKRIMQQRKLQGFELASPDDAVEELVAMSCEKVFDDPNMISRLAETLESKSTPDGETLLDKVIKWFDDLIKRLKSALAKLTGIKANKYAEEMSTKDLEHIRDLFVQAAREIQATDDGGLSESGIEYDAATDTAMMSTKDIPQNEEEIALAVERLSKKLGVTKMEAREWVESELSAASLILDPKFSDVLEYRGDRRYTAIKKNSDYPQGTLDFSNICRKRRNYTAMMQRLQKRYPNRVFTAEELAEIRQILIDNDIQVACGLCFVEDRRQNETGIAKTFQDAMTSWFAGERDGFNKNQTKALQMLKGGEEIPSIYELTTLEGMQELRAKAPNVADAWEKFNNARGMQSARLLQGEAEYKRQILQYKSDRVKRINNLGGLRIFSFSDFEEFHLIDIIQAIQDCAAMGLKIQGYTKVPSFAKLVMDTGTKVNRSLIPKGDLGYRIENGKTILEYDTTEGIDINDPDFFDSTDNPNIGNILVGINDEQIAAAFLDPFVDYIIPFHTGQRADVLRIKKIGAWKNYKDYQEDKPLPGTTRKKGINIYTEVLDAAAKEGKPITNERQFVEKFLEVCKREGMRPRFSQFLNTDENGDYVYRKGYYKVLLDFKLFDKDGNILPQNPVKPIFDNEYINSILTRYAETKAAEEKALAPKMERAYAEIENKLMHSTKDDAEYLELAKDPEKNLTRLSEMVRRAATDAGYTSPMIYHGTTNFGFTKIDTKYSDDNISFFATDSPRMAKAYSNMSEVKAISGETSEAEYDNVAEAVEYEATKTAYKTADKLSAMYGIHEQWTGDYTDDSLRAIALQYRGKTDAYFDADLAIYEWIEENIIDYFYNSYVDNPYRDGETLERDDWADSEEGQEVYDAVAPLEEAFSLVADPMRVKNNFGNYSFYANLDGLAEYDAKGALWNDLGEGIPAKTTRGLVHAVNAQGYKGYILKNVVDYGMFRDFTDDEPATVYVFLNPTAQVKSADAVTYDDNGNIIPLSQRFNASNQDIRYSIKDVAPVQPTNNWWKRTHTTEEAMALAKAYGVEMWKVNAESSEESNPTQMKDRNRGTTSTYRKVYDYLGKDYDGRILDASSGAGIGTEVGREMGYNVTDIEPYPGKTYTPQYQDYTALDDAVAAGKVEPFDFIISNAVLNVVPQDQRDGLVTHMGHMLAPGGHMFVHTRAKREIEELGKKAKNVHLGYGEAVESARGSYQYGFNQKELEAYLQDVLGSDYTVTDGRKAFNVNEATALVTKKSSDTKFSTKDSDGRTLTPEQQEYFKDSKVRDENGNLLVVYHGSHRLFTKFSGGVVGNFFARTFNVATGYAGNLPKSGIWNPAKAQSFETLNGYLDSIGVGLEHKNNKYIITEYDGETTTFGTLKEVTDYVTDQYLKFDLDNAAVYQVYLNITNPFVLDAKGKEWNNLPKNASGETDTELVADWARKQGYDGVIFKNIIDGWAPDDVYVTFREDQQKDVENKKPTSNPDIRYSIKYDDDGNLKVDGASGFSGGGTIDYMLRDIVSHVFAAEYDEDIAAVYEKNNGIHAQRDMLDIKTLEDFKNLPDSLEYAHFSPVCTNFSLANNKRGEAQRDIDFAKRIAEMIEAKMPKCITIEQVPAYAKSKSCEIIRQALKRLGYTFDEGIYNSVDFGGDMSRDRFFMRAIKEGSLPKIVKSGRTTKGWYNAVKDLIPSLAVSTTSTKAVNKGATKTTNYIPTWMKERLDAMGVNYKNPSKPLFIMGTGDANGLVRYYPGNEPIGSVKAKVGEPKIILTNGAVLDVSPRVIARLMGIPDGYELPQSKTRAFKILGNGVPGQLSRAMAVPLIEEVVAQEGYAPKYSTKDMDSEYMELAQNPERNETELRSMLNKAAAKAGYTGRAYHGTYAFGRTSFDLYNALFLTDSVDVARNFSGGQPSRTIAKRFNPKTARLTSLIRYANENTYASDIRGATREDIEEEIDRVKVTKADIEKIKKYYPSTWKEELERQKAWEATAREKLKAYDEGEILLYMPFNSIANDYPNDPLFDRETLENFVAKYAARTEGNGGVYDIYFKKDHMVSIDVRGAYYTDVPIPKELMPYATAEEKERGLATSDQILRMAIAVGYQTVEYRNMREGGDYGNAGVSNVYAVVDSAHRVKSADLVTYDDDGNIIPLSERFNESNNDIRYSTKDEDTVPYGGKAYLTPERVDTYLKDFAIPDMPNRSQGWIARMSPKNFWRGTSNIDTYLWLREDAKPLDADKLKAERQPVFLDVDLDSDGKPIAVTGHEGRHRSMAMANEGIYQEPVILFDYGHWTDNRGEYPSLMLRGQGKNPLDYDVWVYDAIPLDYAHRDAIVELFATPTKEEQLRERYGIRKTLQYSLKEDLSPNEYLASAVLDNIRKPEDRAGLEEYLNRHKELYQETTKLSNEITDLENKLHDSTVLSDSDRESIENRIKTLRKDVRENEKKMWEIVSKPRMQRIIEQQRATIQEYEEEMAKAEEKSDAKIAELRARMDTKVRTEIDKRIAMRKRMLEQQRTQRSRYYYLPRIEKVSKELRKNLEKAPMPFRGPIADFLAALDNRTVDAQGNIKDNKANARKTNLIAALNNMSRIAGTTEEWLNKYNVDFNPEMVTWIDDMVEYLSSNRRLLDYYGDINLNTLSTDMLEGVYKMARSLNTTLKNLTKSYTNKALDISEEAKAVMEFDGKLSHGAADANMAEKIFRWKNAQATTVYQRMGDGGWKMYKLLVKGQSKLAFNEQQIVDFAKSHWQPSDVRNWNKPKNAVAVEISGEKVMMTPAQMMALYATSRDADGLRHLLEGGGFKLLKQSNGNKMVVDVARHMTEMDLANVINALKNYDEKLIKLTEDIQDFIGQVGAEWGNEVSVARFGYEQFGIENYFPLHTVAADKVGTVTRDDADAGKFWSMLNRSFTKERTFKANNALVIDGIFDIFANHMSQMALYNAYALPVLDTARFMNWEVNESVGGKPKVTTLGEIWDKAFGKGEMRNYLTNLLDSIAGAKRMDAFEAFALAGLRLHNRVAVAANFRVAAQQPFSITRAFDELDPKYFAKVPKNIKALQEEMWKNSGIALWKHQGNYDTNIKGSLTSQVMGAKTGFGQFKDDLSEKAMWLAEKGDDFTWALIWNACKAYVSETQPTLTDKAYMDAVVSKFEDVVLLTQVVDTPLQKSEWMREKSFWFKMTSSFKSEPTTSYNMLLRTFDRLSEAKQSGKTGAVWAVVKGPMLRAFATYALTSLVNAMVTAVIDAARDDDDYETLLEKLKFAFIGDYRGKNFGQWITEFMGSNVGDSINPIKSLPWFADAFSLFEGYDADRADLTILEEILTQGKAIWTAITKGDMTYKKVFKLVDALSKVIGIPFANVMRDVTAVWNTVFGRIDSTVKLQISPESKQSGYNAFYYAIQNGETVKAMQIVDEIYSNEISSKTAYTGVTNVIREAYKDGKIDKEDALDYMLMTNDYFDRGFDRAHIKNQVDGWSQE